MAQINDKTNFPGQGEVILNRYQIEERIGSGPFATVYKSADLELGGSIVAIKSIHSHLLNSEKVVKKLRAHVLEMRQLVHGNILKTFDLEEDENHCLHLVTEYCDGWSLAKLFSNLSSKVLKPEANLHILSKIATALEYAHGKEILHLDLKPENILISRDGSIKVSDFTFSRAFEDADGFTLTGEAIAHPAYMAPEQFSLGALSPQTDLYAWAVIGLQLSTGSTALHDQNFLDCARTHLGGELSELFQTQKIPDDLNELLQRNTNVDPSKRFSTTRELCTEVSRIQKSFETDDASLRRILTPRTLRASKVWWQRQLFGLIVFLVTFLCVWLAQQPPRIAICSGFYRIEKILNIEFTSIKSFIDINYSASKPEDLFRAIDNQNYLAVESLLRAGIDSSKRNKNGDTALHHIVKIDPNALLYAIKANLELNVQNSRGESLVFGLVAKNNRYILSAVLKAGADPDIKNSQGYTPLHKAIIRHQDDMVEALLSYNASLRLRTADGKTPVMLSLDAFTEEKLLLERIAKLIDKGAKVRAYDDEGRSTLDYAKRLNSLRITEFLQNHWEKEAKEVANKLRSQDEER